MAPVATTADATIDRIAELKNAQAKPGELINPLFTHRAMNENDDSYEYAKYKPHFPVVDWEALTEFDVTDRGHFADKDKKALFSAAQKVKHLTPTIGTELVGIDLRQLTSQQKDELALLVAERGVVFFRDQAVNIHEQLEIGRHFGPLHVHATTPMPREPGLEEVHVVYGDAARRPDPTLFSKLELWHSDVSYEMQPPCTTSLKVITSPEYGGDTLWTSGYALYSSLSPGMQTYLEGLTALHSGVRQAEGARAAGNHVRREPVESVHPVVRVHPVTGWKSVYVNHGFTTRILGVPKAESDTILRFLFEQASENVDFQVRFHWEPNSIAFWDNRVVNHSAIFDYWPQVRHGLRVTPHGEKPESVEDYERRTGKVALDRQIEMWKQQGVEVPETKKGAARARGYND